MQNKRQISFRLLMVAVFFSAGLITLKASQEETGGGGCIINPDIDKVGYCMQSTEGLWKCIPMSNVQNCTSSD